MKKIPVQEAVGHVLCHDLTRIIRGESKGPQFRKGHIVTEEDIPMLLSMGKEHLYVWEKKPDMLHENEAAEVLCSLCLGPNMTRSEVKEGKIEISAACDGYFRVDTERLLAVNLIDELMIATRHSGTAVRAGDKLCGTRVIPLVIHQQKLDRAKAVVGDAPLLEVLPYRRKTVGVVTTGSEVYHGRIQDTFTPVIIEKLKAYGMEMVTHVLSDDGTENVVKAIETVRQAKPDLILCTGGMSVDPDDNTPGAIRESGASIVTYGAPVLPGAMFLLGYYDDGTPVMGLPGCVMYAAATIFDLVLPQVAADVPVTRAEIARMGNGGLCLGCKECRYPVCPFGKGG